MKQYIQKVTSGNDLTLEEAEAAMETIMTGEATDAQIGSFLTALKMKGETVEEIASFAKVMKAHAVQVKTTTDKPLVDMCGTGGDNLGTFNISTCSMFVVAAAGAAIAKHGNRSITSKAGSADVLEALGANISLRPKQIGNCIDEVGVGFMFAPNHHPAMKYVMPARKQLGVRTVFNILGPLTNPAGASHQLMGVFSSDLTEKMADVFKNIGLKSAMVVHGEPNMDEVSLCGLTEVSELRDGNVNSYTLDPSEYGFELAEVTDLSGNDAQENARTIVSILSGKKEGPKRDIVVLNAAAAIYTSGLKGNMVKAVAEAERAIESEEAAYKLKQYLEYTKDVVHRENSR